MRMTNLKIGFGGTSVAVALAIAGCAVDSEQQPTTTTTETTESNQTSAPEIGQAPAAPNESRFDADFVAASTEYDVPAAVLKAIASTETQYEMVVGEEEHTGRPPAFGVMALAGARLEEGAKLANVSVDDAKKDARANVRAAAALLSSWAKEANIDRSKVAAWEPVIARYSSIDDENARREYVRSGVYRAMKKGLGSITADGSYFDLFGNEADEVASPLAAGPDYPGSIWRASPNYNSRGGVKPSMVVIHTCEGSYAGCWGWLANSAAGASAHYVVSSDGKEISQLVTEANRAWHVAASYDCNLNGGVDCGRQGQSVNTFSIGIEHAGYASQSSFPAGQIEASAALVCDMTKAHGIPRDRFHIVGHGKLQPYNRTDPGPNWPWTSYISRINTLCGSGGTPAPTPTPTPPPSGGGLVIDSNNANNDTAIASVEVSGNWTASTNIGGYHGTGYWWADAAPISDGATFWFHLSAPATKTIDAHWTSASDRSPAAPFVVFDAQGNRLGTVKVDQTVNGGKWNSLGSFAFSAGWNKVVLSRWTGTGKIVVADAVRVR